ncbi:MAG: hypothetical protein GY862_24000, partial [Gammaproteobacteria bacterium]|nr:hypothetical protein [Gammaproteobacteria bacterium]
IHFKLGKTRFNVPEAYFTGAAHSGSGRLEYANLEARLPDFEVYDRKRDEKGGWSGKLMYINLSLRRGHYTTEGYIKNRRPDVLKKNYIETRFGLEVYPHSSGGHLLYIHWDAEIPVLLFRCDKGRKGGCDIWWDFSEDVVVDLAFHKRYLSQWQEIWEKTNALLRNDPSFYAKTLSIKRKALQ